MSLGKKANLSQAVRQMKSFWGPREPRLMREDSGGDFAVLLPLVEVDKRPGLLFEKRAASLKSQPGEICFPGGALEPGESPLEAAVRETKEELLIPEKEIELLGPMDILSTPAGITIYPFLGCLSSYGNTFSEDEVECVFSIPLSWFLENEPSRHRTRVITVPGEDFPYELVPDGRDYRWREGVYDVLFYRWEKQIIWGMTAKILHSFVEIYRHFWETEEN